MDYLELFADWPDTASFDACAVIFSEQEPADYVFVILSGEVELSFHGESLGVEKRGAIIGEMAVIETASRSVTATALTPVIAARLDLQQFRSMIDKSSEFSLHAMSTLANRLRSADDFIRRKLQTSAD